MDRWLDDDVETWAIQPEGSSESTTVQQFRFNKWKRKYSWLEHHLVCALDHGRCKWEKCPGKKQINMKEGKISYGARYTCVQCSMDFGKDQYFCNDYNVVW